MSCRFTLRSCPRLHLALGAMATPHDRRFPQGRRRPARLHLRLARRRRARRRRGLVVYGGNARQVLFDGAFIVDAFGRFMKLLVLAGRPRAAAHVVRQPRAAKLLTFEFPVLILLAAVGMMMMVSAGDLIALYLGLELQSLALYVLAAIRPRPGALERSRPQVLRARRAVVRHAALRRLADLRLHRLDELRRSSPASRKAQSPPATSGSSSASSSCSSASPSRSRRRAFPHVDARRLRGRARRRSPPSSPPRPSSPPWRCCARVAVGAFPGIATQWQQIIVFLSIASMLLGAFAAIGQTQHQAADGLLVDRPRRLRARRPRRRSAKQARRPCSSISRSISS